jgi:hypothetical protein
MVWLGPTLFVASAFSACGDGPEAKNSGPAGDAADRVIPRNDATSDAGPILFVDGSAPDLALPDVATRPDAGEQPIVTCGVDGSSGEASAGEAASANGCEVPQSRCADDRWLVYYSDGKCVDGRCQWREDLFLCQLSCGNYGCTGNFTL